MFWEGGAKLPPALVGYALPTSFLTRERSLHEPYPDLIKSKQGSGLKANEVIMEGWAAQELQYAQLGDARRHKRLVRLVEDLAAQPNESVPQACGDWAATKAAYEFWKSPRIKPDDIRTAHQKSTVERVKEHNVVLAIQDTTDLNFTHHPSKQGVGPISSQSKVMGLKVHSVLGVSILGVPLGMLHQQVWTRNPQEVGKRHRRRQRQTEDKESQRWLTALTATESAVPEELEVVTLADREADIYDLLAITRRERSHLLIRGTHNRRVNHEAEYLHQAICQTPIVGELTIDVPRGDDRPTRQATLTIRFASLEIQPPRHHLKRLALEPVTVQVLLAQEENPPDDTTPISWLLLTTLPVNSFDEAVQYVRWYTYRWLIERYHFVLKSGCRLEHLQLETAERIERALATYSIVSWRLLWVTYEARQKSQAPCDAVLATHEWQALYCTIHSSPIPPTTPPSLQQAVRWIAQLGGFLGRKHDGEPGVKTLWRGWQRLHDIAATWQLLHSHQPTQPLLSTS